MTSAETLADLGLAALRKDGKGVSLDPARLSILEEHLAEVPSGPAFYEAMRELATLALFIEQQLNSPQTSMKLLKLMDKHAFKEAELLRGRSADVQEARVANAARRFQEFVGLPPMAEVRPGETAERIEADLPRLIPG